MAKTSNPGKQAQAKSPRSTAANRMSIPAGNYPAHDVTMQPMPRAGSSFSDSAYAPAGYNPYPQSNTPSASAYN